jgi:septal ring factor EnvC (AmiA/AmiB activator)
MTRIVMALLLGLLLVGCHEKKEETKQPEKPAPAAASKDEISALTAKTVEQAALNTEKAQEKLEQITTQARELAKEAETVGREVSRVTRQVADLNARINQVSGQAREVIRQAQQALAQLLRAQKHLQESSGCLLEEIDGPEKMEDAAPLPEGEQPAQ